METVHITKLPGDGTLSLCKRPCLCVQHVLTLVMFRPSIKALDVLQRPVKRSANLSSEDDYYTLSLFCVCLIMLSTTNSHNWCTLYFWVWSIEADGIKVVRRTDGGGERSADSNRFLKLRLLEQVFLSPSFLGILSFTYSLLLFNLTKQENLISSLQQAATSVSEQVSSCT